MLFLVYTEYDNKHFNKRYHSLEYWFIRIGFEKKLFDFNVYRYDAFTLNEFVLLGITLGYGYNCIAKPVTEELID